MGEFTLRATVSEDCRIIFDAPTVALASLSSMRGKRVAVHVETEKTLRSNRANRYYWSIVAPTFQQIWSVGRAQAGLPPYTKEETHEVLVRVVAGEVDGPMGVKLRKRTSEMDTRQFYEFVEGCRALAREQYGVVLPEPGERFEAYV